MRRLWPFLPTLVLIGCGPRPSTTPVAPTVTKEIPPVTPKAKATIAPTVALLEPYLVLVAPQRAVPPRTMQGQILPEIPMRPIMPLPPAQSIPIPGPIAPRTTPSAPPSKPSTPRGPVVPNALVRLFQEERARSVDDARRRLAAATARTTSTAADAKRLWGFVKDGFVAQRQAENADAANRTAVAEQAEAQKTLDEAQSRQRDARKDLDAAMRGTSAWTGGMETAQRIVPVPMLQPVPETYRLAVLGVAPVTLTLQGGTVLRRVEMQPGEAGAWLVRCVDAGALRVGVGGRAASLLVRRLPLPEAKART